MTRFLFWNVANRPIGNLIASLVQEYQVDVLMLAECNIAPNVLLPFLSATVGEYFYSPQIGCTSIELYTHFNNAHIPPIYETDRLSVRNLRLPGAINILLAVTHFISKLHTDEHSQMAEAIILADDLRSVEEEVKHSRTLLIGDLNMNPFESGMIMARGLHAVMSRDIASKEHRTVQGVNYPYFYNPMWSYLGDLSPGPPGTFYYRTSQQRVFFWHMFDQVLIRPQLLDRFVPQGLRIIQSVGNIDLLSANRIPSKRIASDHLPVLCELDLTEGNSNE